MPNYLVASEVLPLAGYDESHADATRALDFAEAIINQHTQVSFAAIVEFVSHVRLSANSYALPLPFDVASVASVAPEQTGYTLELRNDGLYKLDDTGEGVVWTAREYKITGTRGIEIVDEQVKKAASLLVGYFLGLSDPERSRYEGLAIGDFAGTLRLMDLPVPEAQQLLNHYKQRSAAALI